MFPSRSSSAVVQASERPGGVAGSGRATDGAVRGGTGGRGAFFTILPAVPALSLPRCGATHVFKLIAIVLALDAVLPTPASPRRTSARLDPARTLATSWSSVAHSLRRPSRCGGDMATAEAMDASAGWQLRAPRARIQNTGRRTSIPRLETRCAKSSVRRWTCSLACCSKRSTSRISAIST
jgi:hypothetical protein